jgi:6-phosphogluconolactonase
VTNVETLHFASDEALASAVANAWLDLTVANAKREQPFCVALSGGRIARKFFSASTDSIRARAMDLSNLHFFWADERCVPPNDPESNFGAADELLFVPVGVPEGQTHRIAGEEPPQVAAVAAESEICRLAPLNSDGQPVLDLILLGMGEDGHVASLFPGEPESAMNDPAVYRPVTATKPPPQRVTMGYQTIAAARQVWVLVSGRGKDSTLRHSLSPTGKTPLARVFRDRPFTRVFTDLRPG